MGGKPRAKPKLRVFDPAQIRQVQYGRDARSYPCRIVRCLQAQPRFKLKKGDLLLVHAYHLDPGNKYTVVCRISDSYDPQCNVYVEEVELVELQSGMRTKDIGSES